MGNLVSVITTTYNHEDVLKDCIIGVLSQNNNLIKEYFIADDSSTDNTKAIGK